MIKTPSSIFKITFFLLTTIFLIACQQSGKANQSKSPSNNTEIIEILKSMTVEAIKEQDYRQAQRGITALILTHDDKSWEFIYSAMVSMPQEAGLETIQKALALDSIQQSSEALFGIAKVYISYKEYDKAMKLIHQSIQLDGNNLQARFWRARLLTIMQKYTEAAADFEFLSKKAPDNSEYTEQYASFLQQTKQYDKAQSILSQQKANIENVFRRIIFSLQAKDEATANSLYQQLKSIEVKETDNNRKNFLIAESAYFLKLMQESEEYYKKVLGGDNYLDARDMLSLILFENEKYDEAKEILHQLQNAEEKYAIKAYRLESQIFKLVGDTAAALSTLNRSLQLLPNNPILLYDRAMLQETLGNMAQVEQDLLQIIADDPENYEALNALGYSLADHDLKLDEAYEYISQAIKLAPDNAAIIDSLGWVQYKMGDYQAAEINFKKALESSLHDAELYLHLYHTLIKLNKHQEAQELLLKAQEIFPDNPKFKQL